MLRKPGRASAAAAASGGRLSGGSRGGGGGAGGGTPSTRGGRRSGGSGGGDMARNDEHAREQRERDRERETSTRREQREQREREQREQREREQREQAAAAAAAAEAAAAAVAAVAAAASAGGGAAAGEESDGDEMEHESADSDKSTSSCESSDAPSDSDDSSEMDEEECERRRNECMENLVDLERQFTLLREQLYRERITQVDTKLSEVRSGRAQEYLQPLEELQENMRVRTEVAGVLRELRLQNIRNKFEAEELAAVQNYESEKALLWDSIHGELEDRIRRLEEDRSNVDLSADLWGYATSFSENSYSGRMAGRRPGSYSRGGGHGGAGAAGAASARDGLGGGGGGGGGVDVAAHGASPVAGGRKKPVTVSGPYIVYMLSDADILEDWTAIKKAMQASKRKAEIHL